MLNLKLKLKTSKRQFWTDRQTGSQTVSQAGRQTDRQAGRHTDRQTDIR